MLRNEYNCFADPVFLVFIMLVIAGLLIMRFILS
jgi:hypothetical protein